MKYIILRIAGPLMSFGHEDSWNVRGTNHFPTKSAVIGMISASMGLYRSEEDAIRKLSENVAFSVRQDSAPSLIRDFHTILNTVKADGTPNTDPVISPRHYLSDAAFTGFLGVGNPVVNKQIKNALLNPKWPAFLGRKCCVPSQPLFQSDEWEAKNIHEACRSINPIGWNNEIAAKTYHCWTEEEVEGRSLSLRDNVLSFDKKLYERRTVNHFVYEHTGAL